MSRQCEVTNEGEEAIVIPVTVANSLSDLDLVIEALQLPRTDRKNGVSNKSFQAGSFEVSEFYKCRDAADFRRIKPALPALIGRKRIAKLEELAELFLHGTRNHTKKAPACI